MPVLPQTATPSRECTDLVRHGRITEALTLLGSLEEPSVADRALLLECHLARGEMGAALELGEQLEALAGLDLDDAARVAWSLGELAAATGHDDEAVAHYRAVGDLSDDPAAFPWRSGAALSLLRSGSREAEPLAREQLAAARACGAAYAVAHALRVVAAVSVTADREALLREALDLAHGHTRLAAQVATDLAGLIVLTPGDGRRCEAVVLLREAEEYADGQDLWPLHTRVRRLLELLGETPQTPRTEVIARLTDSELRVARMAALGGTNRSIAGEVGVTVKAVEWHLSHAYRKLGIRGRGELPRALRLA